MSETKELEIVESDDCEIQQDDTMTLAKAVAGTVAEALATAPNNAGELVEAVEVKFEPVVAHRIIVRLMLRKKDA